MYLRIGFKFDLIFSLQFFPITVLAEDAIKAALKDYHVKQSSKDADGGQQVAGASSG